VSGSATYTRYPTWAVALYDGLTVLHFLLGGLVLWIAYPRPFGFVLGLGYTVFAFFEMFVLMPLTVCPACVYYRIEGSLCVSGLNRWSRLIAAQRDSSRFRERAKGVFCSNNLYLVALGFPIVAAIPGAVLPFDPVALAIVLALAALLAFRFFVVFPRVACVHCRAKHVCPNARSMGLADVA
jgi:hypothetical protein